MNYKKILFLLILSSIFYNNTFSALRDHQVPAAKLVFRDPDSLPFDKDQIPYNPLTTDHVKLLHPAVELLLACYRELKISPQALETFQKNPELIERIQNCRLATVNQLTLGRYEDYAEKAPSFLNATVLMKMVAENGQHGENTKEYQSFLTDCIRFFGGIREQDAYGRTPFVYAAIKNNFPAMEVLALPEFNNDDNLLFPAALIPDGQGKTAEDYIREKGFNDNTTKAILRKLKNIREKQKSVEAAYLQLSN
jgi:hypothetical protein